jgi:hypothetical protein
VVTLGGMTLDGIYADQAVAEAVVQRMRKNCWPGCAVA